MESGKWYKSIIPAIEEEGKDEEIIIFNVENHVLVGPDGKEFYPDKLPRHMPFNEAIKHISQDLIGKYEKYYKNRGMKVDKVPSDFLDDTPGYICDPSIISVSHPDLVLL